MKLLAAMLALLLLPTACAAAVPQEQPFTADMLERLRKALPDSRLSLKKDEPLVVLVEGGGWKDAQINLHRIYGYCRAATAEECEEAKREFVQKTTKQPPKATSASLRLVVRDKQYLDYVRQMETQRPKENDAMAIVEPLGDDLFAVLVSDSTDAIALVGEKSLQELDLTREIAWALATKQTRAILPPLPTPDQLAKSAIAFQDQEYLGSLLIDLPAWERIAAAAGPDMFVTVVSDQFVFVGRMPDGPDLDAFKKTVIDDCSHQQRCISPNIYRFRSGHWVVAR